MKEQIFSLEEEIKEKDKGISELRERINSALESRPSVEIDAEIAKLHQRINNLEVEPLKKVKPTANRQRYCERM